jgi:hypothetical protein
MVRSLLTSLIVLLALTFASTAAHAQAAPTVTGTLAAPSTNAAWGSFEVFETSSNAFGFFMRFKPTNGHIYTVVPFEMTTSGALNCWYIDYMLIGASNPDGTQGWQWQEMSGGRVLLDPATVTASSVDGSITQTYQMIGYTRSAVNEVAQPLRLLIGT